MSDDTPDPTPRDVALLLGATADGEGVALLRAREGHVEAGVARPLREGQPLHGGEVVRLRPRESDPRVCDVEVAYRAPAAEPPRAHGPARVASEGYRSNWERIFGAKPAPGGASN